MGGGPDRENVLITLFDPEPKDTIAELKRRFPYFDITYVHVSVPTKGAKSNPTVISDELWKKTTILLTVFTLPPTPDLVPNLKLIHLFSAGIDGLANHPIIKDTEIPLTTSSGIHGPPIAEWVILTTLVASKHYLTQYEWQKEHRWISNHPELRATSDWVGKTVGIAGYGSIGRQVARIFSALGSHVHAYTASPRTTPESRIDTGYIVPGTGDPDGTIPRAWYSGTTKETLHTFLASGLDALVIALPLTPATRHLFGEEEFKILGGGGAGEGEGEASKEGNSDGKAGKRKGFLINLARGPLIDQPALVKALNDEILAGAAVDVTEPEPLPESDPLWEAKNVIITPHSSSLGVEYVSRAYDLFIENWGRKERGEKLFNLVDRKRGY
ncbi:hypothetical protein A1O3_09324 [Capronia epimyces CBS 606.96]|uniref:D-isomer specific 2-hydroxyacid dehydrogenase NAD-binding domain-containing protein n=1 Tax=Capronia epimyces CBS 606.96 TaxID=1182542 RepID=W9XD69_9EURO|nr:uncharacterized protein A1O3_09324 [Capronia epimyces CBS 606.96]EXJ78163.1 hypothetical protein A1O3_09324 [Capronia epimyces CBS 606.96]